jgi:NADH-ubiquinone oxidoreductase chain 4
LLITFYWAAGCALYNSQNRAYAMLLILIFILVIIIQIFFIINEIFILYTIFELSILPIFIIITGWGYQVERLNARLSLMFYTLSASIPLLIVLIWLNNLWSCKSINIILINTTINLSRVAFLITVFILLAFAVKLPIFGVHVWLPKAHVEAPVFGSMILAAVLLKLGSYGLWLFNIVVFSFEQINFWVSISLVGRVLVSRICVRVSDLKIIIAYSSVTHMGLMFSALITNRFFGAIGSLLIIVAHGARSSGMFLISYYLYQNSHSRRLLLTKGILCWSHYVRVFWFLVLISNMAAPPTLNLLSEILIIGRIALLRKRSTLIIILVVLLRTSYSLIIFRSTTHGKSRISAYTFMLNHYEIINIFNHLIWVFVIRAALGMINL